MAFGVPRPGNEQLTIYLKGGSSLTVEVVNWTFKKLSDGSRTLTWTPPTDNVQKIVTLEMSEVAAITAVKA